MFQHHRRPGLGVQGVLQHLGLRNEASLRLFVRNRRMLGQREVPTLPPPGALALNVAACLPVRTSCLSAQAVARSGELSSNSLLSATSRNRSFPVNHCIHFHGKLPDRRSERQGLQTRIADRKELNHARLLGENTTDQCASATTGVVQNRVPVSRVAGRERRVVRACSLAILAGPVAPSRLAISSMTPSRARALCATLRKRIGVSRPGGAVGQRQLSGIQICSPTPGSQSAGKHVQSHPHTKHRGNATGVGRFGFKHAQGIGTIFEIARAIGLRAANPPKNKAKQMTRPPKCFQP